MPKEKAPIPSQGQTEITWTHPIATKDGTLTTDAKMVNAYIEETENGPAARKRAGTSYLGGSASGTAQGQFLPYPNQLPNQSGYYIVNNTIKSYDGTVSVAIPSAATANWAFSFAQNVAVSGNALPDGVFLKNDGIPTVGFTGGAWLWNQTGPTITQVTSANYPSTTVPGVAYLNSVCYVMGRNGTIYGSALNDVLTWPALDFVGGDPVLGIGQGISRHLNYVCAFYNKGLQLWYDAAAAPNGSGIALNQVPNASWRTGCLSGWSVVNTSDLTFFLAQDDTYGRTIQMLSGLTLSKVSTTAVEKVLSLVPLDNQTDDFNIVQCWAFSCRMFGHQHYVITFPTANVTLAFDINTQQWHQWTSVVSGVEQYFVGRFYLNNSGANYLQDVSTGKVMKLDPSIYTDATGPINVTLVTPEYDFGTLNWKRFAAMFQIATTSTTSTLLNVSFTDNDYQSYSVPRTIDMSTVRKMLRNCGSSRRRAWKLTHSDNTSLRLYQMKVDMTTLDR